VADDGARSVELARVLFSLLVLVAVHLGRVLWDMGQDWGLTI
jgi:hypothetical protein